MRVTYMLLILSIKLNPNEDLELVKAGGLQFTPEVGLIDRLR